MQMQSVPELAPADIDITATSPVAEKFCPYSDPSDFCVDAYYGNLPTCDNSPQIEERRQPLRPITSTWPSSVSVCQRRLSLINANGIWSTCEINSDDTFRKPSSYTSDTDAYQIAPIHNFLSTCTATILVPLMQVIYRSPQCRYSSPSRQYGTQFAG